VESSAGHHLTLTMWPSRGQAEAEMGPLHEQVSYG